MSQVVLEVAMRLEVTKQVYSREWVECTRVISYGGDDVEDRRKSGGSE